MNFTHLKVDCKDKIAFITINRPKALNALNRETIEELGTALNHFETDKAVKVLVIIGEGEKSFVAGADIKEFQDFDAQQGESLASKGQEILFDRIAHYKKPVIAAINGFALGGGLELAMASHLRIASENALLGLPEVTLGLIPGYGGTQRLSHLIGSARALEMILTAEKISAEKALEIGLVHHVVPLENLMEKATELASRLTKGSSTAMAAAIKAVNASQSSNGYEVEKRLFGELFDSADFKEGTKAFVERRSPVF